MKWKALISTVELKDIISKKIRSRYTLDYQMGALFGFQRDLLIQNSLRKVILDKSLSSTLGSYEGSDLGYNIN